MHKFSDFSQDETHLDGEKKKMDEVVGKTIYIWAAKEMASQYEDSSLCVQVQFSFDEAGQTKYVFFTGSKVIAEQVSRYKDQMPFETIIQQRKSKKHQFFTLT